MAEDYWKQSAKLMRVSGGMAIAPDPPIWAAEGEIAAGSLSEMVERWGHLPASHRPYHTIRIEGGTLDRVVIEGLLSHPRHDENS